jgi:fumarate reductase flavoprotein subunit
MKTRKIVCLAAAFACVLALAGCGGGDKDSTSAAGNASGLKAGTYEATAPGMYDADVKVKVTIDDSGVITAVEIDSSTQTAGRGDVAAEKLQAAILEKQSAEVDVVTDATLTSNAIITAVTDCLNQAK